MNERSKARKGDRWRRSRKAAFREDGSFALIRRGEERRGEERGLGGGDSPELRVICFIPEAESRRGVPSKSREGRSGDSTSRHVLYAVESESA